MKITDFGIGTAIVGIIYFLTGSCLSSEVGIETGGSKVRLSLPAALDVPGQGVVWPEYTVSRSSDLVHWSPVGGKVRGISGRSGALLSVTLDQQAGLGFFRILAGAGSAAPSELGSGGEEVFGYRSRLGAELDRLGLMSIEEFAAGAPQPTYLPQLSWNPTTAQFWTNFYERATISQELRWDPALGGLSTNFITNAAFRLNSAELALFMTNGFAVSERLGASTFGGFYYDVFYADLPVFVTADSVLQAWHRTYQNMLAELEELELATLVEQVITKMAAQLPSVWSQYQSGPLRDGILDADYFLTVARSLWAGGELAPSLAVAGQKERVAATLGDINSLEVRWVAPFGTNSWRWLDFSQFKARGHYTSSERLRRYFRTMMWCGRTDLRLATFPPNLEDDIRQLGTAIVLHQLLRQSGQLDNWSAVEQVTRAFVGVTDSMTFEQMDDLIGQAGIGSLADLPDRTALTSLQTRLLTGELGIQAITSDVLFSPLSPEEMKLPRSFTFFGQKFVLDSWALSQVVFDKVHWPSDNADPYCGATNLFGKVIRRKPSCLDIAFSVLGNDQAAPEIVERILRTNGVPFRDGLPYQHNLTAARNVIASQAVGTWTNNIYTAWLAALRALSEPTTGPEYPEAMRTRAWAMKNLTTQVASWTQLRHDTVLYAKQSYTPPFLCSYPYGFVEPRPEFWRSMKRLADIAGSAIARLPIPIPAVTVPARLREDGFPSGGLLTFEVDHVKQSQLASLGNFSAKMLTLEGIAQKELNQQALSAEENDFIAGMMEGTGSYVPGQRRYTGWYPALFYKNVFWEYNEMDSLPEMFNTEQGCDMEDSLVTDVHTDAPDDVVCDPGAVIYEGIGKVHLLMIAIDNGPDRMVYAGPVFSHYEFEQRGVTRMSDEEWKAKLSNGEKPPSPEWTRGYLVPSP